MLSKNKMRLLGLFLSLVFLSGCATYQRSFNLIPQKTETWKNRSPGYVQSSCNEGEIAVSPIVKEVLGEGYAPFFIPIPFGGKERVVESNKDGPWMYLEVHKDNQIQFCNLSFVSLEDQSGSFKIKPIKVETHKINDEHTTYCYYYFDSNDLSNSIFNLNISKEVLNCNLESVLYKQGKVFEYSPMQMM